MKSEGAFSKKTKTKKKPAQKSLKKIAAFPYTLAWVRFEMDFVMLFAYYFKAQKYEYPKMLIWLLTVLVITKLKLVWNYMWKY